MSIDWTTWDSYPVIWLRAGNALDQLGSELEPDNQVSGYSRDLESHCQANDKLNAPVWLKPDHNDPHHFISAVEQAIVKAQGLSGRQAQAASPKLVQTAWIDLINMLSGLDREMILSLNGYDQIESDCIHSMVAQLLDYLPSTIQVVLVCQSMPPLPLPRLRARRMLLEVWLD